jgi:DNA replication protein DnaC
MFHRENVERITRYFQEKRIRAEQEATARTQAAEEKNPRLKELGTAMRSVALRVLGESMRGGEDLPQRIAAIQKESLLLQEEYRETLVKMGLPADYTKPRRDCTLCDDSGFLGSKMCTCMKKAIVLEGYRTSGIGKLIEKQRFDNFDLSYYSTALLENKRYSPRDVMAAIKEEMEDYADSFSLSSPSLLFIGGTGLGKTHLSSAIAGKVIEKGFDVVYESAPNIALLFEKDRFGREENSAEQIRRLMEAELLILDDLGTEPSSQTTNSAIYQLINHRAAIASLPTIISTNLSYRQLEKRYETAILSRLLGEFEVKYFQGEDVRMAKLK